MWHKWVLERLDDDQTAVYHRLQKQLRKENLEFSENKVLRYLAAGNFDEDAALETLKANQEFYKEHDLYTLDPDEFRGKLEDEFIVPHKFDKIGRPVVYMRFRFNYPDKHPDMHVVKFLIYMMHKIRERTPKHVDNYILIYDFKDAGWSNFSLSQLSGTIKKVGNQFPETVHKVFVINSGW